MTRFSIITTGLGDAAALELTRQSVAAQDYSDLEHIIVDSTAGETPGIPAARNAGLRRARGELIAYLDAGDCYEPGALATANRHFAASAGCRVLYGRALLPPESGLSSRREHPTRPWGFERLQCEQLCCRPAMFFRRDVASRFGVFDERLRYSFDYDYWLRIGAVVPFTYEPDSVLASCRADESMVPGPARVRALEETLDLMSRHATLFEPLHLWLRALASAVAGADCSPLARDFEWTDRARRAYATALLSYGEFFEIPLPQDELVLLLSPGGKS